MYRAYITKYLDTKGLKKEYWTSIYRSDIQSKSISELKLNKEKDKCDSCTMTVRNPDLKIQEMHDLIYLYQDDKPIFKGRALYYTEDVYRSKQYTLEGDYNFLLDSIVPPLSYNALSSDTATLRDMLVDIITRHNNQVDYAKHFVVDDVTITIPEGFGQYQPFTTTDYMTAQAAILKLQEKFGGRFYLTINDKLESVISWTYDQKYINPYPIRLGENLLTYSKKGDASNVGSVVYAHAKCENESTGTDTKVYNNLGRKLYGTIVKYLQVELPAYDYVLLRKAATDYLNDLVKSSITFELTAVDLIQNGANLSNYKLLDYVNIISEPHELNDTWEVTKQVIDLMTYTNSQITLGTEIKALTDYI